MDEPDRRQQMPAPRRFGDIPGGGIGAAETVALALTAAWLLLAAVLFLVSGGEGNGAREALLTLLGIFLPVGLIWIAALGQRSARTLREETIELRSAVEALRRAHLSQHRTNAHPAPFDAEVKRKLDAIAEAQKKTEDAIAVFTSRRDAGFVVASADGKAALAAPRPDLSENQPSLALGTPPEALAEPISVADFLSALHFPETRDDKAGFRSLRLALDDPRAAKVVRAAQDVLSLLSEDGIYMDDMQPDRTRPELWRQFAEGSRGGVIAGLGAIRDRDCLARVTARMRQDQVFRDTCHHFLRQFDRMLADFVATATDADLARLSETRSARAFMLLGRAAGIFD